MKCEFSYAFDTSIDVSLWDDLKVRPMEQGHGCQCSDCFVFRSLKSMSLARKTSTEPGANEDHGRQEI